MGTHLSSLKSNLQKPDMELGYWALQGIAQPCRYLLHASDKDFTLKNYTMEDAPTWFGTDKPELLKLTPFPNLPYLKVGDKVVSQTAAILRFLGRTCGMNPKSDDGLDQAEIIDGVLGDAWLQFLKVMTNKSATDEDKKTWHEGVVKHMAILNDYLAGKKFLVGDNVTWVDFNAFHKFNILRKWSSQVAALENWKTYFSGMQNGNGDKFKAYFVDQEANSVMLPENYWTWGGGIKLCEMKPEF